MVKNGKVIIGYFNDEFFEDNSILVDCKVIKIKDIDKIEYYKAWIETKLQRAINCNYDQEKIDMIQQVKTSFENREKKGGGE